MPQPKSKIKTPKEEMVPTSIKRPKALADGVDKAMRKMAVELNLDVNHSQLVCILEGLWLESPTVQGLVRMKINQSKG
jgi:hypothetical protein